jgi:hypothetical protein
MWGAFVTKDGLETRELLAHRNSATRNQIPAEARLAAGASTRERYQVRTELSAFAPNALIRP